MDTFLPMVVFYHNTKVYHSSHDVTLILKKSLSQTLTKYYPFAGKLAKNAPTYVDCNDDGVEFLEATIDITLSDFLQNFHHEDLDQLFPYKQIWTKSTRKSQSDQVIPLAVQVNHFECGGVAIAVSLCHKIADGSSITRFLNDWGKTTSFCSKEQNQHELPIDPRFVSVPNINISFDGLTLDGSNDCVTKSFMFPNSKLNELKLKVSATSAKSGHPINDPTRVEVLNWLLYKSVVANTTNKLGFSNLTGVTLVINLRNKMMEILPENTIGNLYMLMKIFTNNKSEMELNAFVSEVKKQKIRFNELRNIETGFDLVSIMCSKTDLDEQQRTINGAYFSTSLCGFPTYEIDFGWGKPLKTTLAGNLRKNSFVLMDTPNKDGIEVLLCVGKQDMDIMENDPELLAFC